MKFSTREDVTAPIGFVFDSLSDFDGFQRAALRRGAEVTRTDKLRAPGPGMTWNARFFLRGKPRQAVVKLAEHAPPSRLAAEFVGKAFEGAFAVSLISLSPRRTRVVTELEFRPRTMAARLIVQSLRLARRRLNRRFKDRVGAFARGIEAEHVEAQGQAQGVVSTVGRMSRAGGR